MLWFVKVATTTIKINRKVNFGGVNDQAQAHLWPELLDDLYDCGLSTVSWKFIHFVFIKGTAINAGVMV